MKSVKFVKPWSMYSPGDVAGFEEKRAQSLIDTKSAVSYEADGDAEAADAGAAGQASEQPADSGKAVDPKPARTTRAK